MTTNTATRSPQKRSGYDRADLDFYIEPEWTVELLLDRERFDGVTWDPACGSGTIPAAFEARGLRCHASDIVDRGWPGTVEHDFLSDGWVDPDRLPVEVDNIVTNPPYGRGVTARRFVNVAREIARCKVAAFVRADFLFSQGRRQLLSEAARVYVLSKRPSCPPGDPYLRGEIEAKGGQHDYCWVVWDRDHTGKPQLDFVMPQEGGGL